MEIVYLAERQRIEVTIFSVLNLVNENQYLLIHNLDPKTVTEGFKIKDIPELHDRLIAGTAAILQAALITNDPVIRESEYIETIW
jgi:predicted nucleic acid-binding protein